MPPCTCCVCTGYAADSDVTRGAGLAWRHEPLPVAGRAGGRRWHTGNLLAEDFGGGGLQEALQRLRGSLQVGSWGFGFWGPQSLNPVLPAAQDSFLLDSSLLNHSLHQQAAPSTSFSMFCTAQ